LLQLVHFDIVKIDKVFLQDNRYSADGKGSLWHMVQLASCFSPVVVVEGVETNNQVARARAAGATHLQGYLLARPCFIGTGIPAKVPLAAP
jgi:EAL domain-containing protein (putative c-di-GMP-specific phosphodiesterase class I)